MQRLIAASLIVLVLLIGGAGFGFWTYRQNREHPVFVPLQVNPSTSVAKREEIAKDLKAKLSEPEFLLKVSKKVGLKDKWQLDSDEAGAVELERRLFVNVTETTVNIGVNGKRKERIVSGEVVKQLMEEVGKILGIKLPTK